MLETVREFGRMRLVEAGDDETARAAQRAWATDYALEHAAALFGPSQFAAADALRAEESNLAELLRQALSEPNPATVVQLLAGVGPLWTIRGDHPRIIVLRDAIAQAVTDWHPPPELEEVTRVALLAALMNIMVLTDNRDEGLRALLSRLPLRDTTDSRIAAMTTVVLASDPSQGADFDHRLKELSRSTDRDVALVAAQMSSHVLENAGDLAGAVAAAERALTLVREDDGPWFPAILHAELAHLILKLGDNRRAVGHARTALPALSRLGATDDETQLRSVLVFAALADGDHAAAEAELMEISRINDSEAVLGGLAIVPLCTAELALARGRTADALAEYRLAVERARAMRLPGMPNTAFEPWVVTAEALALTAHAYHAEPADLPYGEELFHSCAAVRAHDVLSARSPFLDYPVWGSMLFAFGVWGLLRGAMAPGDAVRFLVLAERFSYNYMPIMSFERIEPHAEGAAPGMIATVRAEYGDRRGADLLDEARRLVEKVSYVPLVAAHRQRREDRDDDQAGHERPGHRSADETAVGQVTSGRDQV
jgi:tetratricopeptide (TPR) repeat protein